MKVRILPFLTTFTQLTARLKNFLWGWLLVFNLKEGLVECATLYVKNEVILLIRGQSYRFVLGTSNSKLFAIKRNKSVGAFAENLYSFGFC